nr:bromodomain and WD repeat-containing protein 3 [Ciona intestinalis]|eukprot:XP_009860425.1 bromodomain and WD repeat-containing protein 3 [Ciona intestinalis]
MESKNLNLDLYFLIERFLSKGPCAPVSKVLREVLNSLNIVPKRFDWKGGQHVQSYDEWTRRFSDVGDDHLLVLCNHITSMLDQKSLNRGETSLLQVGRNSLSSDEDIVWKFCHTVANINAKPMIPPHNYRKKQNWIHSIKSREYGCGRLKQVVCPVVPVYGKMNMCLRVLGHLSSVYCVLFDRTGSKIFTGSDDSLIKCWCAWSGRLLFTFRGHQAEICDMDISYDNILLAAGSCNKEIRVWDVQTAEPVAVLQGHSGILTSLEFSPVVECGRGYLISTGRDGNVCFWLWNINNMEFNKQPVKFQERSRPGVGIMCASWSMGGRFAVAGGSDSIIHVYCISPGSPEPLKLCELSSHSDKVDSIWFSHSGLQFASASCDGRAIIWSYVEAEWRSLTLNTDRRRNLNDDGEFVSMSKVRVIMVTWTCDDQHIMTSHSDFSIKVWKVDTASLLHVLKGHEDEAYCLEAHPNDGRILLSAGHDGKIFLWDINDGQQVINFHNLLVGQGHGAVFDAKFSPTGNHIACTDSHGHLILFGFGDGKVYKKVPDEQFFHTDYRPLLRDMYGAVVDEQTHQAPNRMPPPFLVDVDGNPHPAPLQRLVPGRQNITTDALVPVVVAADNGVPLIVNEQPDIVADLSPPLNEVRAPGVQSPTVSPSRNTPLGLRREGEVVGVRNSSSPRSEIASAADLLVVQRRELVPLLKTAVRMKRDEIARETGFNEISIYNEEITRKNHKSLNKHRAASMNYLNSQVNREKTRNSDYLRKIPSAHHSYSTRLNSMPLSNDEQDWETTTDASSAEEPDAASVENYHANINTRKRRMRSDSYSEGWSSEENEGSPVHSNNARKRRKCSEETSICDVTTETLDENQPTTSTNISPKQTVVKPIEPPFPIVPGQPPPDEYLPPKWISQDVARPSPYMPQIGDCVVYFQQGHQLYIKAVLDKNIWNVGPESNICYNMMELNYIEVCNVTSIEYEIGPPTLCCLQLQRQNVKENEEEYFKLRFHDLPDVIDFIVLQNKFDISMLTKWKPGDRFRSIIDDEWWFGSVVNHQPLDDKYPESPFQSLLVEWDSNEVERMSPWDLEPTTEGMVGRSENDRGLPIEEEELKDIFHQRPSASEWRKVDKLYVDSVDQDCSRISTGIEKLLGLDMFSPFSAPVDLTIYQAYTLAVAYPTDLKLILRRLQNRFYRSLESLLWDVQKLEENALAFNEPDSDIVKKATILHSLLGEFINNQSCHNIEDIYATHGVDHIVDIVEPACESDHSVECDVVTEPTTSDRLNSITNVITRAKKSRYQPWISEDEKEDQDRMDEWKGSCSNLLSFAWDTEDASPFREGVNEEHYPDYYDIVEEPMNLTMIREKLSKDGYNNPKEVESDLHLMFTNSKAYNTNKKSKIYSMTVRLQALIRARMQPIIAEYENVVSMRGALTAQLMEKQMSNSYITRSRRRRKRSSRYSQPPEDKPIDPNEPSSSRAPESRRSNSSRRCRILSPDDPSSSDSEDQNPPPRLRKDRPQLAQSSRLRSRLPQKQNKFQRSDTTSSSKDSSFLSDPRPRRSKPHYLPQSSERMHLRNIRKRRNTTVRYVESLSEASDDAFERLNDVSSRGRVRRLSSKAMAAKLS